MSVIGLDLGTSRVKAVRFDAEWRAADAEAETTVVERPRPGCSQQSMPGVWAAAVRVTAAVVARSPDPVELIAVTGQGDGCWLVDGSGAPVGPAMLWNDARAADILAGWERDGTLATAFAINGCSGSPGLANAQLRWLASHEPGALSSATHLLSCASWVWFSMTGQRVLDASEAVNPFLDVARVRYDERLLDLYGLRPWAHLLPPVVMGADRIAPLRPQAATALGLPAGTPIALTPYDVVTSTIGTGTIRPGDGVAILGTTLCPGVMRDTPDLDRTPVGVTLPVSAGRWLVALPTMVGTEVLDWATALLGLDRVDELMALAATATSDDRPLLLPYLSPAGERSPFLDPDIQGSLHGLTIGHNRADFAQSVVDGLSLAVRDGLVAAGGAHTVALAGGGARSEHWAQTIADATGAAVACVDTLEVGARGAALVGATDLGRFVSLDEAVTVVQPAHTHAPDRSRQMLYDDRYARYLDTRSRLRS